MSKNNFPYPKGSEWRKWDLHVHTKSDSGYSFHSDLLISKREQNDKEYPRVFIEHLYSVENLGAIAITDHNRGDWIDKLINENNKHASSLNGRDKITILPGVEIESGDGIHLLVIFNPDTQLENVKYNFRKSTWKETIEHFITAVKNLANPNTFKTTEEIMEEAKKWDAVCIFAHVTSNKGFFKISSGDRKIKIYKHNLTQIFQIPKDGITDDGILNIINGKDQNYGYKSVTKITASDAKRLIDIGTNNCWIKADPTFEGLKQIIYEPEERVYIGEEPPCKIERNKIIKSITISNSNGWFEDKPLPLNEGLVSIIGGKGTGKTALLDLIAYAAGSYKCYEKDEMKSKSFLKKAFKELKNAKIKLEWDDGTVDEKIIGDKLEEAVTEGKVRYLPQDFTDQLCSEIGKAELEKQIENVIFQKIPSEDRADFNNFQTYKEAQLKVINDNKSWISQQIIEINSEIYKYQELINSKEKIEEDKRKVVSAINILKNEMEKISKSLEDFKEQKEILDILNSKNTEKSKLEKEISKLKIKQLKIEEIKNKINKYIKDADTFIKELKDDLNEVGIAKEDIEKVKIILYPQNLQQILDERKKKIDSEIANNKENLDKINQEIKELEEKIKFEKSKQEKIREINKSLSDLENKKDALDKKIEEIKQANGKISSLKNKRERLFINYFELIFEEKEKLKKIYSPLRNILEESGEESEKLFEFTVKFNFDIDTMAEEGHELIDLRAEGRFRQSKPELLREELEKLRFVLDFDKSNISDSEKESIKNFLKKVEALFTDGEKSISSQLKQRYTQKDFDNWLFFTKYYGMSYSIKFNGIELNNLSPGLKGVALLILFLELDKDDKRPILIDQPEENLDNRSVYNTLVRYFREAKKRRQVIIVTHNPNLVVNTDSEQVIVANFDKGLKKQPSKICYVSGSIENTFKDENASNILEKQGIREHICEILEGGEEAFRKREEKYQIK